MSEASGKEIPRRSPPALQLISLVGLYFAQGLPFGFQATALPVYMREQGASLESIGLVSLLSMPWMFKALWAPLVDRYRHGRFGHYRSWIIPLQASLMALALMAAWASTVANLSLLLGVVFVLNLVAATQDIAVDGLAIRMIAGRGLGRANAAQVVGYKLGMLTGGGLLVWLTASVGWAVLFVAMAAAMLLPLILTLLLREPDVAQDTTVAASNARMSFADIARLLREVFSTAPAFAFAGLVLTYKLGESAIDAMFKPFLFDHAITAAQIGLWVGTYGLVASLLGSFLGGEASRLLGLRRALLIAGVLRAIPLVMTYALSVTAVSEERVIVVTIAEHLFGGLLTTTMFACMMASVDRRLGATHFTLLATLEVIGKSPGSALSGFVAHTLGYPALFAAGSFVSIAWVFGAAGWALSGSRGAKETDATSNRKS
jgi:PAT family beta-lactamase induction signal transducer AmpG